MSKYFLNKRQGWKPKQMLMPRKSLAENAIRLFPIMTPFVLGTGSFTFLYPCHKMWEGGAIMDLLSHVRLLSSSFPLYKSYTKWRIFFKLGWNVHLNKGMCRPMLPMCQLKVKVIIEGHNWRSNIKQSKIRHYVVSAL